MGLYLTVISMCLLASLRVEVLPLLILPLLCGVPLVLWRILRRICDQEPAYRRLSPLWLAGIYTFIFGTLICCLISALYIVLAEPRFVSDYIAGALRALEGRPDAEAFGSQIDLMHRAIEGKVLPGSLQFVASMGWATCFFGSMLSLIEAFLLSAGLRRRRDIET